jgi:hypothetical protein
MLSFTSTLSHFHGPVYGFHFPLPPDLVLPEKVKRYICHLPDGNSLHSGIMFGTEYRYILINEQLVKKMDLEEGIEVVIQLEPDTSKYGMEMPEEFQIALEQDQEGSTYFDQLTPGKKRNLIYLVAKVKNPDIRIHKSLTILYHHKAMKGKLDFKILNQHFKTFQR